jgi:hypothetical protein
MVFNYVQKEREGQEKPDVLKKKKKFPQERRRKNYFQSLGKTCLDSPVEIVSAQWVNGSFCYFYEVKHLLAFVYLRQVPDGAQYDAGHTVEEQEMVV